MTPRDPGPEVRILHLDDEHEVGALVSAHLEWMAEEVTVTIFTSPMEALDRLEAGAFDCIVSDYDMPEMDGLAFFRAVRALDATVPFILFTGEGSEALERQARRQGATAFLRKGGVDCFAKLRARIRSVVDLRASVTDTP